MSNWACNRYKCTCMRRSPTGPFFPTQIGCQPLPVELRRSIRITKASFHLEQNTHSKGIKCKFATNRKAVSWRHILPQHDNKVKDQGLDDSGGGERSLFWIAPVYSTNTIKLQCSILLHPHHSTLAQQIHQTRLNAFSWKWKQKTQRKEAVTVKTEEHNQVIHRENSAIY